MNTYWISLPYATFGITEQDGIVREAAPIAKWCVGKRLDTVLSYYRRKGAEIVRLEAL